MNDKHQQFLNKLIYETQKANIYWESLFIFTDAEDINEKLPNFKYILWPDEWHSVDYTKSYLTFTDDFIALVLTETIDSGSDYAVQKSGKTKFIDNNIYIAKNVESKPYQLSLSNESVQELIKVIEKIETIPSELDIIIDKFIGD